MPVRGRLTRKQYEVLTFLRERILKDGMPPTVREIAERFGFSSHSSAEKHLVALEQKGLIHRRSGIARNIELVGSLSEDPEKASVGGIPIVGRITAGQPLLAVENLEGSISLKDFFGSLDGAFALRVRGDSMIDAGIQDGDYVIVRQQPTVANGEIAVAYLGEDSDTTIKRIFFERNHIRLQPENAAIDPIYVTHEDPNFRIGGKVIGLLKRF